MVFPVPERPGEVEGQPEACGVSLSEPPASENQGVITNLGKRLIQSPFRLGRKNDIRKSPNRSNDLHGTSRTAAGE